MGYCMTKLPATRDEICEFSIVFDKQGYGWFKTGCEYGIESEKYDKLFTHCPFCGRILKAKS